MPVPKPRGTLLKTAYKTHLLFPKDKLIFLARQVVITAGNALIGFVVLRSLPKVDYAVYTIVFSLLSIFTNITNVGITPAMSGLGGKIWNQPRQLQALLNTALHLRGRLGWWFAAPFVAYCVWQFRATGLGWAPLAALVVLLLLAAWVQLQAALYAIVLQLNKAVQGLQRNELAFVALKLGGVVLLLWLGSPLVLVVGWICGCMVYNLFANQQLARHYLKPHADTDAHYQAEMNGIIRSNFTRTVYWSLEGQISILLCTLFATAERIAEIGALGRLSVFFTIFQAFILNYSLPRLAKLQGKSAILMQAQRILLLTVALILPILFWAVVHPQSLLWILGPNYHSLGGLLFFYLVAASMGQVAAVVYSVCATRAWIRLNRYYVPLALPLQVVLIQTLDLSQLQNVVVFLAVNNCFFLLFNLSMFYFSYKNERSE